MIVFFFCFFGFGPLGGKTWNAALAAGSPCDCALQLQNRKRVRLRLLGAGSFILRKRVHSSGCSYPTHRAWQPVAALGVLRYAQIRRTQKEKRSHCDPPFPLQTPKPQKIQRHKKVTQKLLSGSRPKWLKSYVKVAQKWPFSLEIFILGLNLSFSLENYSPGPCFSAVREGLGMKKPFSIENFIPYWKLDFFNLSSRDWFFSILPKGPFRTKNTTTIAKTVKFLRRSVFTAPPRFTMPGTLLWEGKCL